MNLFTRQELLSAFLLIVTDVDGDEACIGHRHNRHIRWLPEVECSCSRGGIGKRGATSPASPVHRATPEHAARTGGRGARVFLERLRRRLLREDP